MVAAGVAVGVGVAVPVAIALAVGVAVAVGAGVEVTVAVGDGLALGLGVGVGLDAATTVKFTIMEAPVVPVPFVELHGVAVKVWFPIVVGVQVKSKGVAESVFTVAASLLNTTLCVFAFA
jgi:hypothetical protein